MKNYTTRVNLNIRSTAAILPDNIITTILKGSTIRSELEPVGDWLKVIIPINEKTETGYCRFKYLTEVKIHRSIPKVHLDTDVKRYGSRGSKSYPAYPLAEFNMPKRQRDGTVQAKINALYSILNYLEVESSIRYQPAGGKTYCNIYACDFTYLSGVYIPRIWWTKLAIVNLMQGQQVPIEYGKSVLELNANSLYNWFETYAAQYGWTKISSENELQLLVNQGKVGIIVAKRLDTKRSGHITAVLPETNIHKAIRVNNIVTKPLQSQAGLSNKQIFTSNWHINPKFSAYGLWICD
ncbi:MAG: SH3 domain-containing protein [Bacteroidota bacterium]|nr:SH3 domain-containing protein [Bacteroidota bacterium]